MGGFSAGSLLGNHGFMMFKLDRRSIVLKLNRGLLYITTEGQTED